jgi:hypothetical protein
VLRADNRRVADLARVLPLVQVQLEERAPGRLAGAGLPVAHVELVRDLRGDAGQELGAEGLLLGLVVPTGTSTAPWDGMSATLLGLWMG